MDRSWMTKWRGSREYMEGAEVFVKYAVTNSKNKNQWCAHAGSVA